MHVAYEERCEIFVFDLHRRFLPILFGSFLPKNIVLVFQKLVRQLVYGLNFFRHADSRISTLSLFESYRAYCLIECREISGWGLRREDYRIYVRLLAFGRNFQMLFHKRHDVPTVNACLTVYIRSGYKNPARSSIHLGRLFSLLFPKTVRFVSRYTLFACQTPFLICQSPDAPSAAGNF